MKKLIGILVAVVLLLGACGQNSSLESSGLRETEEIPTWQEQYNLGVRYLSEGNYQEAIIAFTAAIEIDPKQADAYIGLANAYEAQGNIELAHQVLSNALGVAEYTQEIQDRLTEIEHAMGLAVEQVPLDGYPKTERYDFGNGSYIITELDQFGKPIFQTIYDENGEVVNTIVREYNEFGNIIRQIQYGADGSENHRSDYEYNESQKLSLERWSGIGNYMQELAPEFNSYGVNYFGEDGRVIESEDYSDGFSTRESHITYHYSEGSSVVIIDINSTTYKEDLHIIYTMESAENQVQYGGGHSEVYIIWERTLDGEWCFDTQYNLDGSVISREYY